MIIIQQSLSILNVIIGRGSVDIPIPRDVRPRPTTKQHSWEAFSSTSYIDGGRPRIVRGRQRAMHQTPARKSLGILGRVGGRFCFTDERKLRKRGHVAIIKSTIGIYDNLLVKFIFRLLYNDDRIE